jgi:hypothetical protein
MTDTAGTEIGSSRDPGTGPTIIATWVSETMVHGTLAPQKAVRPQSTLVAEVMQVEMEADAVVAVEGTMGLVRVARVVPAVRATEVRAISVSWSPAHCLLEVLAHIAFSLIF